MLLRHISVNQVSYDITDDSKIPINQKGVANGVAELDSAGKVPSLQLPSFVDDVVEYPSLADFPATGESGKIYIAIDTNKTYRWSGTTYVAISSDLALGETSSTAYRGDRGKAAYDHSQAKGSAYASGLYKIETNAEGHVSGATAVQKSDIMALGIPGQDTTYNNATQSADGLMSSTDKTKLDGVAEGATANVGTVTGITMNGTAKTVEQDGTVDIGTVVTAHQDISGKADKVSSATSGNFAGLDGNGNLTDSGSKASDFLTSHQDISGKADKVSSATSGNFASLDSNGNLTDSGHKHSDYLTAHQDISGKADKVSSATSGNFASLDSNGNLTDSGKAAADFVASNQGAGNAGKALGIDSTGAVVPQDQSAGAYYGESSTGASTQKKEVTISGTFTGLQVGTLLDVKFTNGTSYNGKPILKIGSLEITVNNGYRYMWNANAIVSFVYDGTYFYAVGFATASTTYYGITKLSSSTSSTSEAVAATAKAVKLAYDRAGTAFTGATASAAGAVGVVPAPSAGANTYFLRGDATWAEPPGGKLVVVDLDTVTNTSGSYTHSTTVSDITADMKPIKIELGDPSVFLDTITVTTADGSITLSCNSVEGTSTVKVSLMFVATSDALTSSEFDILNNRINAIANVVTEIPLTITPSDWDSSSPYSYEWTDERVLADSAVEVEFLDTSVESGTLFISYEKSSGGGGIVFTPDTKPTANVAVLIVITNAKAHSGSSIDADTVATDAVTGAVNVQEALEVHDTAITKLQGQTDTYAVGPRDIELQRYPAIVIFRDSGGNGVNGIACVLSSTIVRGFSLGAGITSLAMSDGKLSVTVPSSSAYGYAIIY